MIKKSNAKLAITLLATGLIIISSPEAHAASSLSLYNYTTSKSILYTGQQVKYKLDSEAINMRSTPGIIVDGSALASYYDVFANSDMDVNYKYNSTKTSLTLTKGSNSIKYTIGSKKAYVNGKAVTLSVAPVKVKYKSLNVTKVLVPTRFTAEKLGYGYTWSSSTSTATIERPLRLYYNGKVVNYTGTEGKVSIDGKNLVLDSMPSIIINDTAMVRAKKVFKDSSIGADYSYNSTKKVLTLTKGDKIVKLTMGNPIAYVNGKPRAMNTAPLVVKNLNTDSSYIMVPGSFVASYLGYDYEWKTTTKTSVITSIKETQDSTENPNPDTAPELGGDTITETTFFNWISSITNTSDASTNLLKAVTAGTDGNYEYLQLDGLSSLDVQVVENGNQIVLNIPSTTNGVGDKYMNISDSEILKTVQVSTIGTTTQITLYLANTPTYTVTQGSNTYKLSFLTSNTVTQNSDISIALPSGIDFSKVKNEDRYFENKFKILIPGDYQSFYQQNPVTSNNSMINNISVGYQNNYTEIIVQTNELQGYKLMNNGTSIGIDIGNPREIYQNIVVLDAGHGGTDPGASYVLNGTRLYEKDINLKIMYTLTKKYFNAADSKIKVYYSRYNNTLINLHDRAAFAEKVGADLFVSLHMNAAPSSTTARGTDVYYSTQNNPLTDNGLTSKGLASLFLNYLPSAVGTRTRSVLSADYTVLEENTVPAILIELGFMTNQSDLALMADSTFQEKTAKAIYDTLNTVFTAYPTGR